MQSFQLFFEKTLNFIMMDYSPRKIKKKKKVYITENKTKLHIRLSVVGGI